MGWQGLDCGLASFPVNLLFIVTNGCHSFKHILYKIFIFITLNYCCLFFYVWICAHTYICWQNVLHPGAGDIGLVLGMQIGQSFQPLLHILKWEIKSIFSQDKRFIGSITKLKNKLSHGI